jgi:hypothetical protein
MSAIEIDEARGALRETAESAGFAQEARHERRSVWGRK